MNLLTFTSLYPSSVRPHFGTFVETRLRELLGTGRADSVVVAPVPWFPFRSRSFGRYGDFARVPREETRSGIKVLHPRFVTIPGIGVNLVPWTMAAAGIRCVRALSRSGYEVDAIDAHYFFPDGVAGALLARRLGKPLVITARGSDLNLFAKKAIPRRLIRWAAGYAHAVITVSDALRRVAMSHGIPEDKLFVLRNGVDTTLFSMRDRAELRDALGLVGRIMISVGHLVEIKGHDLAIRALPMLPEVSLLIAGDGPQRSALEALARREGVMDRVRFLSAMPQPELARYYGAADVLVLASEREGWPNVLLEAMACGTPAVAAHVGGVPEIIAAPEAGRLIAERTPAGIADAVRSIITHPPVREATRRYAERFGWGATTAGQLRVFESAIASRRHRMAPQMDCVH